MSGRGGGGRGGGRSAAHRGHLATAQPQGPRRTPAPPHRATPAPSHRPPPAPRPRRRVLRGRWGGGGGRPVRSVPQLGGSTPAPRRLSCSPPRRRGDGLCEGGCWQVPCRGWFCQLGAMGTRRRRRCAPRLQAPNSGLTPRTPFLCRELKCNSRSSSKAEGESQREPHHAPRPPSPAAQWGMGQRRPPEAPAAPLPPWRGLSTGLAWVVLPWAGCPTLPEQKRGPDPSSPLLQGVREEAGDGGGRFPHPHWQQGRDDPAASGVDMDTPSLRVLGVASPTAFGLAVPLEPHRAPLCPTQVPQVSPSLTPMSATARPSGTRGRRRSGCA